MIVWIEMMGRTELEPHSPQELLSIEEDLRRRFREGVSYRDYEARYIDAPFVNQEIDIGMQGMVADLIVGHIKAKDLKFDAVAGIPDSGVPLATSVAERLDLKLLRAIKGDKPPKAWDEERTTVVDPTISYSRDTESGFVLNHAGNERVLLVDDVIGHGNATGNWVQKLLEKGNEVFVAAYFAKLFQDGVNNLKDEGIEHYYAIGIEDGWEEQGGIAKPRLSGPQFSPVM